MKKSLRTISLCLVLAMIVVFSGCGKKQEQTSSNVKVNETGMPIVNEKITLKVMGSKGPLQGPWDQLYVFEAMEKMTNIHLEFDTPPSQNYQEKKNIMFASGEYPDVFFGGLLTSQDEVMYGEQGILVPLEGYIDTYAPNLKKIFEKYPDVKKSITTMDGHIYALPYVGDVNWELTTKLWINQKWMDKVGKTMPTNVDELYDLLIAFKEQDANGNGKNDVIPLSFDNSVFSVIRPGLMSFFGIIATDLKVDVTDHSKVRYYPASENYKEYLKFMNKLNREGLIDPEAFIQTNQQVAAKGNENRIGLFANAAAMLTVGTALQEDYVALSPLTSSVSTTPVWPKKSAVTRGTFAITKENKYPEATMRWVDTFYSEEGGIFLLDGDENVSWRYLDDTKEKWERIMPEGEFKSTEEFRGGKISPAAGTPLPAYMTTEWRKKLNAAHVPILVKEVQEKYEPYMKFEYP